MPIMTTDRETPDASRHFTNLRKGGGRTSPNKATREIKAAARAIVSDPAYLASLIERLIAGQAPHMEVLLHHYAYGKPKERIAVEGTLQVQDLSHVSDAVLAQLRVAVDAAQAEVSVSVRPGAGG